jgi:hypothetical protein
MRYALSQVFGVSTEPVASYIERPEVDAKFVDALKSDKQIVVYGASKQGKTSLVSRHLPYHKNIVVSLTPRTTVLDVYQSILRQSGVTLKTSETLGSETEVATSIGAKFKALIPLFGSGEAEAKGEISAGSNKTQEFEEIPINIELPQDVSEVLKRAKRNSVVVILENFHYLDEEKQRQLAFDLRTFQELKVQFVILGVWRERNRLAQFNGDLLDRVTEVPVEPWTREEFVRVSKTGCQFLNIELSESLKDRLIDACFSSIGVFQELLKETCIAAGISQTMPELTKVQDEQLLSNACQKKAEEYSARHQRALESIAAGNVSNTSKEGVLPLYLTYYLVKVILSEGYDGLATGMRRSLIHERIQAIHHRAKDVRASDMSNLLYNIAKTQAGKSISPPIIDYDQSKKMLQVVDSTFFFFLKHADLKAIAEEIPNPTGN